ncbi:M3 family metallopeptidase [Neobacillus piezotolerans]|uniref:M3 family metallopeptidase n=1 Tax=Neobacillus piezotolerans TaxID=2259171 RepID=UPI0015F13A13|nr:M3 family metallopeptidase [Neobacillus piezotolerans]
MSVITRKDVPVEETWDLTPIFARDEEWEKAYIQVGEDLEGMLQEKITLDNAKTTLALLQQYDALMERFSRVSSYAFYKYSEDGTDPENQRRLGRTQSLGKKSYSLSTVVVNQFLQLPKAALQTYLEEEGGLHTYHRFLEKIDNLREHSLKPEMEDLLSTLGRTLNASNSTYLTITASDLKFDPVEDKDGKDVPVSLFMYMTQVETSPDTVLRRNAYKSLSNGLKNYQHGLAHTLTNEIHKNVAIAKLRQYPTTMDYLLHYDSPADNNFYSGDGIPRHYFEDVLDTFQQELAPHMQRYARLRKRQLGLDKLLFSDVKAPLDPDFDPPISYEEAGEIIVEAVGVLGPEYQEQMRKVFTDRWVYRGDNVGRRMIAFGGGVHGVHGYSFYPWGGNLFDVILLGHELGHAIHLTLAAQNQKFINNGGSLLFVEAPSTLVEHLIVQYLRENRDDPRLHRWLNMYLMMSYHHNCVTHILEAELLRRLYKMADQEIPLTTSVISDTKGAILSEFWGDTVEIDEGAKLTWMRQPHYYMGLYPFTYSIGTSASTVVANRIKEEGISVGEQWTEVLKRGGTLGGFDLYKMAGLDMSTTDVIKQAISHIGTIVDELEKSF